MPSASSSVNSYVVGGEEGIVAIDPPLLVSDAAATRSEDRGAVEGGGPGRRLGSSFANAFQLFPVARA